jgi:hypothetical protein
LHTNTKTEKKRQKEQYVVEEMIRLYCRKNHSGSCGKGGTLPRLSGAFGLCQTKKREMSLYGRKNLLCQLQGALL